MLEAELGFDAMLLLYTLIATFIIFVIAAVFKKTYVVVKAHQAHIVVDRNGRKVYCSRKITVEGKTKTYPSTYFYIPLLKQRIILPLENVPITLEGVSMRDVNMAKFGCDVACWFNITDPELAAERLGIIETQQTEKGFPIIEKEISNLIQAITRNAGMKMEIVQMMKDRAKFSQEVEDMIDSELKAWGMELIDLEIIHFVDIEGNTIIKSLESRQGKVIESETRKLVAEKEMEAAITESSNQKDTKIKQALNRKDAETKVIETDEQLGIRTQNKESKIADAAKKANDAKIKAASAQVVGQAEYEKTAAITKAEAEAKAVTTKGQAAADVVTMNGNAEATATKATGLAEAEVIESKMTAEATGKDKLADATKKYVGASIALEAINAGRTVTIEVAKAYAEALKAAKITIIAGGGQGTTRILGLPLDGTSGADLGMFREAAKAAGFDIDNILEAAATATGNVAHKALSPDDKTKDPKEDKKGK